MVVLLWRCEWWCCYGGVVITLEMELPFSKPLRRRGVGYVLIDLETLQG